MTALPNGWVRKTLGEVAAWGSGGTPQAGNPRYYGGQIPWAIIGDLTDSDVFTTEKHITEEGLANSSAKLAPAGAILIAMYGSIGKMGIAKVPMATNQAIAFALPKPDLMDAKYLFWYLRSQRDVFLASGKGATQQNISQTLLKSWEIPVPPLDEQKQIVEALDDHLAKLDKALAELHEAEHNIELLIESYRHDVVSGVYSQGIDGWRHARLGEIARWGSGGTPQSGNPKYYGGSIPWCVIGDLTESDVILTEKSITDEGLAASSAKIVQPGTVLLAMYGASIGRTGLAATPMATNQAIAFAVPNPEVDPRYLLLFLQSQKRKFVNAGKGGAQPNISQTIIKDWSMTFPPVEEQRRLIQQAKEHQQSMAVLMEQNHRMKTQVSMLTKSLLNAAFTGELKV
jgi:type I restriction enzyme S subunit